MPIRAVELLRGGGGGEFFFKFIPPHITNSAIILSAPGDLLFFTVCIT
jgi:hypothetical protein